jgi:hypothetical protein
MIGRCRQIKLGNTALRHKIIPKWNKLRSEKWNVFHKKKLRFTHMAPCMSYERKHLL